MQDSKSGLNAKLAKSGMGPKELPEGVGDTARRHRGKTVRLRKANLWGGYDF